MRMDAEAEAKYKAEQGKEPAFDTRSMLPESKKYDYKLICLTLAKEDFEKADRYFEEFPFSKIYEEYGIYLTRNYSPYSPPRS